MNTVELYEKLKPFLRVFDWHPDYVPRCRALNRGVWQQLNARRRMLVRGLRWAPGEKPECSPVEGYWGDRPTFAQFCEWYRLDMREGLE